MKRIFLSIISILSFSFLLSAQNFNLELRSEVGFSYTASSLWGYAAGGREYALVGTDKGVSIIEITDPDNPVTLFNVDHVGAHGLWRELKTYGNYCYATNETNNGVLIIDLQNLPNSITQSNFIYDPPQGVTQTTGHTIWIDEKGRMFIFGGSYSQGYACFDLTVDPLNPPYIGKFNARYIHDGFVRGDTLWAGEISDGISEIINVADPANPIVMASWSTPGNFTHNIWPTSDNKYCFTTDEISNSFLASYDVTDFDNVTELDREQSNPGSNVIIHNVHLYNDQFATVAYYRDGVVIFDVSHPDNMIQVGSYDTDPGESGSGFNGTWGVYPYLPSGNIIASDLDDEGANGGKLSVLTPTWVAACWLEGLVTDSVTTAPLAGVFTEIISTIQTDNTDLTGSYKTGIGVAGNYTVRFSKLGYVTKEIQNVVLTSGVVTILNIKLAPLVAYPITGQVTDSANGSPIQGAKVFIRSAEGDIYNATTDVNGNYSLSCFAKTYDIFCGKWSYKENGIYGYVLNPGPATINFKIQKGYYDDFILDLGWTITNNASTGKFVRGEPIGTLNGSDYVNPEFDISGDWGDFCFMTGNGGGSGFTDDVDNGTTTMKSPVMDLSNYNDAVVKFYTWFDNYGGQDTPNDSIVVYLSDGLTKKMAAFITVNNFPPNQWNYHEFHVNDFMTPSANMQVTFSTTDLANSGNVLEAAVDYFKVIDALGTSNIDVENENSMSIYPNPFSDATQFNYRLADNVTEAKIVVRDVLGIEVESIKLLNTNGTISIGDDLSLGIYFVSLQIGSEIIAVNKILKVK